MPGPERDEGCVSLILVSHSAAVADGIAEMVSQLAGTEVSIVAIGGAVDGGLGTDGGRVREALKATVSSSRCIVLTDIGSTVLAVRAALGELADGERGRLRIADAPLVEGAIAAAVSASTGASLEEVTRAAEDARFVSKRL